MDVSARGRDTMVKLDGAHVVLSPAGAKGKVMQAVRSSVAAYRDPDALLDELEGPKRAAMFSALNGSRTVLAALLSAIREENENLYIEASKNHADDLLASLMTALRLNRRAVAAALSSHKTEIGDALRRDKDALAVLLCTYVPINEIESVEVVDERTFRITERGGERHAIPIADGKASEFAVLVDTIRKRLPERAPADDLRPESLGLDDLPKLRDLRDTGVITDAEFETKKREILGLDRNS